MNEKDLQIRQKLKNDFEHYALKCLNIRAKESQIIPFKLNRAQQYIHSKLLEQERKMGKVRAVILKGRQQGCSTYVEGRFFWRTIHSCGVKSYILTHLSQSTEEVYRMVKLFHKLSPDIMKPSVGVSNAKELYFDILESGYRVGTAGSSNIGRGTTIQNFHGSEVGFWDNAGTLVSGVMQAIPDALGTEIILESTANGEGTFFHNTWMSAVSGETDYLPIFVPWYWQEEYQKPVDDSFVPSDEEKELIQIYQITPEQLSWRRDKIKFFSTGMTDDTGGQNLFKQEYPNTPEEAFLASGGESVLISPAAVNLAMNANKNDIEAVGAYIVGVDVARFGDDRSAIIRRKGRAMFGLETYSKKDTMELAGILYNIIKEEPVDKIFIDVIGVGSGVVDRLRDMGFGKIVQGVNSSCGALKPDRYPNKRCEMWGEMASWLADYPCYIEPNSTLRQSLCSVHYRYDSKGRIKLEAKEETKKRLGMSPDEADAAVLTFAFPVRGRVTPKRYSPGNNVGSQASVWAR